MGIKSIAMLVIFIIFVLPSMISIVSFYFTSITAPPEKVAEKGAKLIAEEVVPWWVGVIDWLVRLPSQIAGILITGFVFFLIWIGAFK